MRRKWDADRDRSRQRSQRSTLCHLGTANRTSLGSRTSFLPRWLTLQKGHRSQSRSCYSGAVYRSKRGARFSGQSIHCPGEIIIQQWLLGGALIAIGMLQAAFYKRIRRQENSQAMAAPPLFRRLTGYSNRSRLFFVMTRCVPLCAIGVLWIVWPFPV